MTAEWLITAFFLMPCSPTNFCASFLFLLSRAGFWIWTEFDSFFLLPTIRKNVAHLSKKKNTQLQPGSSRTRRTSRSAAWKPRGRTRASWENPPSFELLLLRKEPPKASTIPNPLNELAWLAHCSCWCDELALFRFCPVCVLHMVPRCLSLRSAHLIVVHAFCLYCRCFLVACRFSMVFILVDTVHTEIGRHRPP